MKKRASSLLLVLALCLTLWPTAALAQEPDTQSSLSVPTGTVDTPEQSAPAALALNESNDPDAHTHGGVTFTTVTTEEELRAVNEGNVCLGNNINLMHAQWQPTGTVTLCLNGHVLKPFAISGINQAANEDSAYGVTLQNGAALTLVDCQNTGILGSTADSAPEYGVAVLEGGTFTMESGATIARCEVGVVLDGGTFRMMGGAIKDGGTDGSDPVIGIEYRAGRLILGGDATVTGNRDYDILLTNANNRIEFDSSLKSTARFGICAGMRYSERYTNQPTTAHTGSIYPMVEHDVDGKATSSTELTSVTITAAGSEQYFKNLIANRCVWYREISFIDPDQDREVTTNYELYLTDTGAIQIAERQEHRHCLCGKSDTNSGYLDETHEMHGPVTFQPWNPYEHLDANGKPTLPTDGGSYYLTRPIDAADSIPGATWSNGDNTNPTNLCLNGYTINTSSQLIVSGQSTTLNVTDCQSTGAIVPHDGKGSEKEASPQSGGTLALYGGTLSIPVKTQDDGSTFYMHGGKVANTGRTGVTVGIGSTFYLYGGEISGNTAGTQVANLTRYDGGGVYVQNGATFRMSGGTIQNNTAARNGGGVMIYGSNDGEGGTFTMTGGTITGNIVNGENGSTPFGGGVFVSINATFQLQGNVTITGNTRLIGEASNVRLGNDTSVVTLTGPLTGGTGSIGISKASGEQRIAVPTTDYSITEADKAAFANDDTRQVTLKDDGSLYLVDCLHNEGYTNGECSHCGYKCPHTDVNEGTGTCNVCKLPISVKLVNPATTEGGTPTVVYVPYTDDYGTDAALRAALKQAEDGSTLTLLRDDVWACGGFDGKTITLDLNGKRLVPGNGILVNSDANDTPATLKLIGQNADNTSYEAGRVVARVFANATLDLSGWTGTTLDGVALQGGTMPQLPSANCTLRYLYLYNSRIQLTHGRIGRLEVRYATTTGSLLAADHAFRRFGENTEYVPYATQLADFGTLDNVEVVSCPHEKIENGVCAYCNKTGLVAKLTVNGKDTFYTGGYEALTALCETGGTLTLYADLDIDIGRNDNTLYLRQKTAVVDLNGHTFRWGRSIGEFSEIPFSLWDGTDLTIRDSSPNQTGKLSQVSVSGNNTKLTVEAGAYLGSISLDRNYTFELDLKAGAKLGSLDVSADSGFVSAELLQPGDCLSGSPDLTVSYVSLTTGDPMVVGKVPGTVTVPAKTGALPYQGTIPAALLPTVTLNASAGSVQLCYDWYRKVTDSYGAVSAQHLASVSPDGVCTMAQTAFDGVQVGDTLSVFCIITAKDANGATLWQTPVSGYTLTITKGTPTITGVPTAASDLIYNTTAQTLLNPDGTSNADGLLYSLSKNGSYSAALPTGTDAGEYKVWYKARGNAYYNDGDPADEPVTVTIQPKTVTAAVTVTDTPTYTGQPLTPAVTVTDGAHTIPAGEYTLEYTNNTNAGTNTATVTVVNKGGGNYIVSGSTTFSIAQAAAPAVSETGALTIVNGVHDQDYTFDLTALLPAAPAGSYGTITYTAAQFSPASDLAAGESYTVQTATDANGQLTLTVTTTTGNHVGQIGTVLVRVETSNYQPFSLELTISADPKPSTGYSEQVKEQIKDFEAKKRGEGSEASAFDDVNEDDYFFDAVQWAVKNGITNGVSKNRFGAALDCTRGQTVTLLWRAAGKPETGAQPLSLRDVAADSYCYPAVQWAMQTGVAAGKGANRFAPEDTITRGQLATFLYRLAGSPAVAASHPFTDVPAGAYYAQAVAWAYAEGIANGTGKTTFSPDTPCTRAQIVTFLYRVFSK